MTLVEQLKADIITAMKNQDKVTLNTLRSVKGALQLEILNKKEESDELLLDVINKQIKLRNDSIKEFEKGNRNDLIDSYTEEINILKKYMPKELTEEELNKILDDAFLIVNPQTNADLGKLMKELMPKVKNKCDMGLLNKMIKERLNN